MTSFNKILLLTFFSFTIYLVGHTQSPCDLIRSASLADCKGNKKELIENLEKFRLLYPTDSLIGQVNLYAAGIYFEMAEFDKSKEIANQLLHKSVTTPVGRFESCPWTFDSIRCLTIIGRVDDFREIQYNACQILYKISFSKQQFDSALYYLKLADSSFLADWIEKFRGRLKSATLLKYSETYEKMGEFDKAIDVLIPYIIEDFGPELISLLKKYKNIDTLKETLLHLEDFLSIQYESVSENPIVTYEYSKKTGRVLRTTSVEEYGRVTYLHFLGHKFPITSVNDYKSNEVRGEAKKRKLEPVVTDNELILKSKAYIQTLAVYKALMEQ